MAVVAMAGLKKNYPIMVLIVSVKMRQWAGCDKWPVIMGVFLKIIRWLNLLLYVKPLNSKISRPVFNGYKVLNRFF